MRDIIIDLQSSDTWKIQLTIAINFVSSKDSEKERYRHSTHDNIKFTSYYDENAVYERYELIITVYELFELLSLKYQGNFRNINERK